MSRKSAWKRSIMIITLATPLAAFQCIHGGISRHASLSEPPDFACIENAVRSVDAVDHVRYEFSEGGRPMKGLKIMPASEVHNFHYKAYGERGVFYIEVEYNNEAHFQHGWLYRSYPPPPDPELQDEAVQKRIAQKRIDTLRPVMIEIERAVARQCHMPALIDSIEESCSWIECRDK